MMGRSLVLQLFTFNQRYSVIMKHKPWGTKASCGRDQQAASTLYREEVTLVVMQIEHDVNIPLGPDETVLILEIEGGVVDILHVNEVPVAVTRHVEGYDLVARNTELHEGILRTEAVNALDIVLGRVLPVLLNSKMFVDMRPTFK